MTKNHNSLKKTSFKGQKETNFLYHFDFQWKISRNQNNVLFATAISKKNLLFPNPQKKSQFIHEL